MLKTILIWRYKLNYVQNQLGHTLRKYTPRIEGFSVFWGMGLQSNKLKEHASLKRKVFDKSINDRRVILHWQSKKPHSERKTLVYEKTNVEDNINLKVQIICRNNFRHSLRDTHPELKGFQFCLGYGTPDKQTEGIRGLKEEGDCLQLTIDRKRPSILLTVSFLSSRLDEEG